MRVKLFNNGKDQNWTFEFVPRITLERVYDGIGGFKISMAWFIWGLCFLI